MKNTCRYCNNMEHVEIVSVKTGPACRQTGIKFPMHEKIYCKLFKELIVVNNLYMDKKQNCFNL